VDEIAAAPRGPADVIRPGTSSRSSRISEAAEVVVAEKDRQRMFRVATGFALGKALE